jgi:glycosyltransferase involved in cell wall biosynthesis
MPSKSTRLRITSVIPSFAGGGVATVCRYAAEGMATLTPWDVTLLNLHDPKGEFVDPISRLRIVCLGLDGNCAQLFLEWLAANPQDLIITSDVSRIEAAFPYLPSTTRHIVQVHDSRRRYREVATRNQAWINGVTCVGHHIETPLSASLEKTSYAGLLHAIHNGANFPPLKPRQPHGGPLRLLFIGGVEAFKGVFDFVPILCELKKRGVPVTLNLVGGENESLRRVFLRKGVGDMVIWSGRQPHARCYDIAAESDILMMTSRKEAFGMATIEGMSMGCVPIAYDIPSGSIEIIEDGKSGLLVPLGDYKAWAASIESLHLDRRRLSVLSDGAIDRARTQFNASVMAENLAEFVQNVLLHAVIHPAQRLQGHPPATATAHAHRKRGYYRLPEGFRTWIRNKVCSYPRFSHWLLSR